MNFLFRVKSICFAAAAALLILLISGTTMAASEGWQVKGGVYSYYRKTDSGLEKLTGYQLINKRHYYFDENGVMKTGWVRFGTKIRYFRKYGSRGVKGRQFSGLHTFKGKTYLFRSNGYLVTSGLTAYKGETYYFQKTGKLGVIGSAVCGKWVKVGEDYYYFGKDGKMVKDCWVDDLRYAGSDGKMLTHCLTPDGYWVGTDGRRIGGNGTGWRKIDGQYYYYSKKKGRFLRKCFLTLNGKKYYINAKSVRVSGLTQIGTDKYYFDPKTGQMQFGVVAIQGKEYYFGSDGKMVVGTTVNGYTTDSSGVITSKGKRSILVIAGHGQGDPGAMSDLGQEYLYTREFAKLIVNALKADGSVNVVYYKNGSTSYDMYQRSKAGLAGIKHTGSGANRTAVVAALQANPDLVDYTQFDYVLEIHFNALASDKKDLKGDGEYHGIGFFLSAFRYREGGLAMENGLMTAMAKLGFKKWAGGIALPNNNEDYHNMSVCREVGVPYGLLETAFIDDKDDMTFYRKNKTQMANLVAQYVIRYYG